MSDKTHEHLSGFPETSAKTRGDLQKASKILVMKSRQKWAGAKEPPGQEEHEKVEHQYIMFHCLHESIMYASFSFAMPSCGPSPPHLASDAWPQPPFLGERKIPGAIPVMRSRKAKKQGDSLR